MKLSTKINVLIIISLFLFMIIPIYIMMNYTLKNDIQRETEQAEDITELFAKINSSPLERMDYFSLDDNARELMSHEYILYASVFDSTGFHLTPSVNINKFRSNDNILVQKRPITGETGVQIGYVQVGYSFEKIEEHLKERRRNLLFIAFSAVILTVVSLSLLMRYIINKPVNILLDSVKTIAKGNLEHQASGFSNDEIGELAANFNEMTIRLKKSLALIQNIIESMPSLVISLDASGEVMRWNSAATQFTGIPAEKAVGNKLWDLDPRFSKYKTDFLEVIEKNKPTVIHKESFVVNDEIQYHNVAMFPLVANGITGMVFRVDDITEIEKKEQQLRQAQKMEIIGTLAGGLAHDFNNVLGGIIGSLSLLQYKLNNTDNLSRNEINRYLSTIGKASNRASSMIKKILSLSSKQDLSLAPIDLKIIIKHTLEILENTIDKSVEIIVNTPKEKTFVNADLTQIEQVLLNLCVNSAHAMTIMRAPDEKQGGKLIISLNKMKTDKHFEELHPDAEENTSYWNLSVQDEGVGMDTKTVAKVFDPFFTTKGKGKGTGLGLAMVYNIVKQHEGFIDIYSEVGIGTKFSVYIPVLEDEKYIESTKEFESQIQKGSGTVLIIDDEQAIRDNAEIMLNECGYTTLTAYNGLEGVKKYTENRDKIDIVLLDLVMPKKSGKEVFKEIVKINPEAVIILSSGFKRDEKVEKLMNSGVFDFIQKPYTIYELSKTMSKAFEFKNSKNI